MRKTAKLFLNIFLVLLLSATALSCRFEMYHSTVITLRGSDTMVLPAQFWADRYMELHPDVLIEINGGGSSNGIASLLNGTTDIAASSRQLNDREILRSKESNRSYSLFKAALDGIAVVVHSGNKIDSLTLDELKDIYTGRITNYRALGGDNLPVNGYGRINSSGTYQFFREVVLDNEDFDPAVQMLLGNSSIADMVAEDESAIGYIGLGYAVRRDDIKILYLKESSGKPAVAPVEGSQPSYEVIRGSEYPLRRYLYLITLNPAPHNLIDFIEFVQSEQGQQIVEEAGFIPLEEDLQTQSVSDDTVQSVRRPFSKEDTLRKEKQYE